MEHFVWNADPVIFTLGPFALRWYGLLFVSGFIIGFYIMCWIFRQEGRNPAELDRWLLYIFAGALIGARLGHCLFYEPAYYLKNPLEILFIWKGGLASHGGTVGVLLGTWLFRRRQQESLLWLLDRLAIPTALASALIRTGNFFNSEIIGVETSSRFGIIFARHDPVARHPAQLYEAAAYLLVFAALFSLYKTDRGRTSHGLYLGIMMLGIFLARFCIEYIKPEYAAYRTGGSLNMGQLLSIPFVVLGLILIINSLRNRSK